MNSLNSVKAIQRNLVTTVTFENKLEFFLQEQRELTLFIFLVVIQVMDLNGKKMERNLSIEMRRIVIIFPAILALLNHV